LWTNSEEITQIVLLESHQIKRMQRVTHKFLSNNGEVMRLLERVERIKISKN
jgi:hypothetical protein